MKEYENDPVLDRIEHQLFHLVERLDKIADGLENLSGNLDGLVTEIFKYRMDQNK